MFRSKTTIPSKVLIYIERVEGSKEVLTPFYMKVVRKKSSAGIHTNVYRAETGYRSMDMNKTIYFDSHFNISVNIFVEKSGERSKKIVEIQLFNQNKKNKFEKIHAWKFDAANLEDPNDASLKSSSAQTSQGPFTLYFRMVCFPNDILKTHDVQNFWSFVTSKSLQPEIEERDETEGVSDFNYELSEGGFAKVTQIEGYKPKSVFGEANPDDDKKDSKKKDKKKEKSKHKHDESGTEKHKKKRKSSNDSDFDQESKDEDKSTCSTRSHDDEGESVSTTTTRSKKLESKIRKGRKISSEELALLTPEEKKLYKEARKLRKAEKKRKKEAAMSLASQDSEKTSASNTGSVQGESGDSKERNDGAEDSENGSSSRKRTMSDSANDSGVSRDKEDQDTEFNNHYETERGSSDMEENNVMSRELENEEEVVERSDDDNRREEEDEERRGEEEVSIEEEERGKEEERKEEERREEEQRKEELRMEEERKKEEQRKEEERRKEELRIKEEERRKEEQRREEERKREEQRKEEERKKEEQRKEEERKREEQRKEEERKKEELRIKEEKMKEEERRKEEQRKEEERKREEQRKEEERRKEELRIKEEKKKEEERRKEEQKKEEERRKEEQRKEELRIKEAKRREEERRKKEQRMEEERRKEEDHRSDSEGLDTNYSVSIKRNMNDKARDIESSKRKSTINDSDSENANDSSKEEEETTVEEPSSRIHDMEEETFEAPVFIDINPLIESHEQFIVRIASLEAHKVSYASLATPSVVTKNCGSKLYEPFRDFGIFSHNFIHAEQLDKIFDPIYASIEFAISKNNSFDQQLGLLSTLLTFGLHISTEAVFNNGVDRHLRKMESYITDILTTLQHGVLSSLAPSIQSDGFALSDRTVREGIINTSELFQNAIKRYNVPLIIVQAIVVGCCEQFDCLLFNFILDSCSVITFKKAQDLLIHIKDIQEWFKCISSNFSIAFPNLLKIVNITQAFLAGLDPARVRKSPEIWAFIYQRLSPRPELNDKEMSMLLSEFDLDNANLRVPAKEVGFNFTFDWLFSTTLTSQYDQ